MNPKKLSNFPQPGLEVVPTKCVPEESALKKFAAGQDKKERKGPKSGNRKC